ncbi:MAG: sulfotransferase [Steroidobacteraceae bacterium]|jgi:tetratricopeptide (TPR) repeat protein
MPGVAPLASPGHAATAGAGQLCACGSGLTRARCCELNLASLGAREASRHLAPLEQRAVEAQRSGAVEEAERLALDVLELAPGRARALTVLYEIRKAQGRAEASAALIRRIVALEPNNFWATNELTLLLLGRGNVAEAEQHARNAVRIAPENAQSHYLMGMVLTEANRPAVGEYHYQRALELSGARDPVVLANLALCLKNQGKMREARVLYEESLSAAPQSVHALLGLARLEEADRNLAAALSLLERAEALSAANPNVQLLRATVLGRMGEAPAALAVLDAMAAANATLSPLEWLEKGRLLDRMGRYEEAFAAFDAGRARLREVTGQQYLDAQAEQLIARLTSFFVAKRLATLPRARTRTDLAQPLFVLGFPRSGTTLLEQSLSAHPRIAAGDELPFIIEIAELMPRLLESPLTYPEALSELWMGDHRKDLDHLRDHYLRKVVQLRMVPRGAAWFTDKMPLNETHMGLIGLLFPDSPLLHVVRHPLDVVLSVFSNLLTHGLYCAYALESAARHYVRVMELVEHYGREMQLKYLRVRYEDMVDDQEASIRRVLEFIGEPFDAKCLDFHENRRYARTASYAQVTEKLYDRSRYRYRHYLPQLQSVIPILAPVIERLGYTV